MSQNENEVPDIVAVEPVFPAESDESRWVFCTAQWDADREAFVNHEASYDWTLDDQAFPDSSYIVEFEEGDEEYSDKDEAVLEALKAVYSEDEIESFGVSLWVVDPKSEETPEWGATV